MFGLRVTILVAPLPTIKQESCQVLRVHNALDALAGGKKALKGHKGWEQGDTNGAF